MFVHRSRLVTQGALATAALLGIGLSACDDPVALTDLRPEGDPEVLTVLVMNDPFFGLFETATYCKENDPKRPGLVAVGFTFETVQICDADLSLPAGFRDGDDTFVPAQVDDAPALDWFVRVQFDELLNTSVEDLVEITEDHDGDPATPEVGTGQFFGTLERTQPVVLRCTPPGSSTAIDIAYDGYYSPSGNSVTWPLGPSLVVHPVDPTTVATSSTCTLEIKDSVVDKQNNSVPADQRGTGGMYSWEIEPLFALATTPRARPPGEEEIIAVDAPVIVRFNAFIDPDTLDPATEVTIREGDADDLDCTSVADTGTLRTAQVAAAATTLRITIAGGWVAGRMYAVTFNENEVADVAGGPGSIPEVTICFVAE
jgi:hypothetical protein